MLVSHALTTGDTQIRLGMRFSPLCIEVLSGTGTRATLPLAGTSDTEIRVWIDTQLESASLRPVTGISLPYEWSTGKHKKADRHHEDLDGLALMKLRELYADADGLIEEQCLVHQGITPGPSPVRCWPHHFDLATLVSFDEESSDVNRSISIGFSPGDESYETPYFYVAPWPYPEMRLLPDLAHGHWHTDGFLAGVLTLDDPAINVPIEAVQQFFTETMATWRKSLDLW